MTNALSSEESAAKAGVPKDAKREAVAEAARERKRRAGIIRAKAGSYACLLKFVLPTARGFRKRGAMSLGCLCLG